MDVTKSFMSEKDGLLQYGLYAARLPMAVVKVRTYAKSHRVLWGEPERSARL